MNKETIEKATNDYSTMQWKAENDFECRECMDIIAPPAFIAGAEWRINSAWHNAKTETPVHDGYIAVLLPNGVMETTWYNAGIGFDETRLRVYDMWAYVSNLTPDRKGGKK